MWLRLRQICLVASELQPALDELGGVFDLSVCHVDPGVKMFGLENSLLRVGSQFLEVVAPVKPDTTASRYLERRGGDGGYMVITQCDDPAPRRARAEALGVRVAFELDAPGECDYRCMQLHPRDTGGSFFEIDWNEGGEDPAGAWFPAGPHWRDASLSKVVTSIAAAELQSPDPESLARRWGEIAELPVARDSEGRFELQLENARLRFALAEDGRGEGLGGVDLATADPERALRAARSRGLPVSGDTILAVGTRFRLVPG